MSQRGSSSEFYMAVGNRNLSRHVITNDSQFYDKHQREGHREADAVVSDQIAHGRYLLLAQPCEDANAHALRSGNKAEETHKVHLSDN